MCYESSPLSIPLRDVFSYHSPIQASESTQTHVGHSVFPFQPAHCLRYWIYSLYSLFDGYNLIAHLVDLIWHASAQTVQGC